MNNYLLSVDPSMKNTGFTLWEKNISKDWKKIKIIHHMNIENQY